MLRISPIVMEIHVFNIRDEKNVLNKVLPDPYIIEGTLRDSTSITDPHIIIHHENPADYNYIYIPAFSRYYFITDIKSIRTNIWDIALHVDVLNSFKDEIKQCVAIIDTSEKTGITPYLSNDAFKATVKTKTDIISFSSGLSESGHYILITAGG